MVALWLVDATGALFRGLGGRGAKKNKQKQLSSFHWNLTKIPSIIQQTPQGHSTTVEGVGGDTPAHRLLAALKAFEAAEKALWPTCLIPESQLNDVWTDLKRGECFYEVYNMTDGVKVRMNPHLHLYGYFEKKKTQRTEEFYSRMRHQPTQTWK